MLLVLPWLSACGFQLQGANQLPESMSVTYIESRNPYSDVSVALRRNLVGAGVTVTRLRSEATAVLRLIDDETGQRLLSVSAENVPEEFEVYYTVGFELIADGERQLRVEPVTLARDYGYDTTQVLAKRREEAIIRQALADDLARLMMRRLAALD